MYAKGVLRMHDLPTLASQLHSLMLSQLLSMRRLAGTTHASVVFIHMHLIHARREHQ